jgi:hypothetical protein
MSMMRSLNHRKGRFVLDLCYTPAHNPSSWESDENEVPDPPLPLCGGDVLKSSPSGAILSTLTDGVG